MKRLILPIVILFVFSCNNADKKQENKIRNPDIIIMTPGGLNDVKLTDTLVIYETVCRGCAYEESTHFEISDSMGVVKLDKIETIDNNPGNVAGGSIDKHIYLVPVKAGHTKLRLYKFNTAEPEPEDSLRYTVYDIEIKN